LESGFSDPHLAQRIATAISKRSTGASYVERPEHLLIRPEFNMESSICGNPSDSETHQR
jgi:hypothetical protein